MPKLEIALLVGEETKLFLSKLTTQLDRLEALSEKLNSSTAPDECSSEEDDDDEDEVTPKKTKAKVEDDDDEDEDDEDSKDADDDEDTEADEEDDEDVEETPPKKEKAKKAKKLTSEDCSDAAKALAKAVGGKPGRAQVFKLMKKKFKVESIMELKESQYESFIEVMNEAREELEE